MPGGKYRGIACSLSVHVCCQVKTITYQIVHIEHASGLGPATSRAYVHISNISSCSLLLRFVCGLYVISAHTSLLAKQIANRFSANQASYPIRLTCHTTVLYIYIYIYTYYLIILQFTRQCMVAHLYTYRVNPVTRPLSPM